MSASAMLLSLEWRTVRSCALHPGWLGERMSAEKGGELTGYVEHLYCAAPHCFLSWILDSRNSGGSRFNLLKGGLSFYRDIKMKE